MAFSTQQEFFHVPFMNESVEYECITTCVDLKSYETNIDDRSWALDDQKQSRFLRDLVTCDLIGRADGDLEDGADDGHEGGDGGNSVRQTSRYPARGTGRSKFLSDPSAPSMEEIALSNREGVPTVGVIGRNDASLGGTLATGDSVLECANIRLAEYQKLLNINTDLQRELDASNERLKNSEEEKRKIKEILATKLDFNVSKDFYNKIRQMSNAGKFTKNEENELLQLHKGIENSIQAYEVLQAENNYIKRLVEKLALRANLENINTEPETSTDTAYLQNEINKVRKECVMLRQIEDDYQKIVQHNQQLQQRQQQMQHKRAMTEQDAENIKAIVKERNALRDKCKSFKGLEQKVADLLQREQNLNANLNNQSKYINNMEDDIQKMQKLCEEQQQQACFQESILKAQLEDLKEELMQAKCQAQKAELLQMEISCLRNEIMKRDIALSDYDCQYKQLMGVIDVMQGYDAQNIRQSETKTKLKTDDLAFYTQATLSEITKELAQAKSQLNQVQIGRDGQFRPEGDVFDSADHPCCLELQSLQRKIVELEDELNKAANCEDICAEALKRLKELEHLNAKLRGELDEQAAENEKLLKNLSDCNEKINTMLTKINDMENELNKTVGETATLGDNVKGTLNLVKDISEMQIRNQQLANAVKTINSRDDQKEIDDLKKKLQNALDNLEKCKSENSNLEASLHKAQKEADDLKEQYQKLSREAKDKDKDKDIGKTDGGQRDAIPLPGPEQASRPTPEKTPRDQTPASQSATPLPAPPPKSATSAPGQQTAIPLPAPTSEGKTTPGQQRQQGAIPLPPAPPSSAEKTPGQQAAIPPPAAPPSSAETTPRQQAAIPLPAAPPSSAEKTPKQQEAIPTPAAPPSSTETTPRPQAAIPLPAAPPSSAATTPGQQAAIPLTAAPPSSTETRPGQQAEIPTPLQTGETTTPAAPPTGTTPAPGQKTTIPLPGPPPRLDATSTPSALPLRQKGGNKDGKRASKHEFGDSGKPSDKSYKDYQAQDKTTKTNASSKPDRSGLPSKTSKKSPKVPQSDEDAAISHFVDKKAAGVRYSLNTAANFEKELRKILDEFIQECGFCFCRLVNPRSRFYTICHKLYHNGIHTLSFRELAYLHKRIYAQAEQILPGCLLDMIISDHVESARSMLINLKQIAAPTPEITESSNEQLKCCSCKSKLCCTNSDFDVQEKLSKLERDVADANAYFYNLINWPKNDIIIKDIDDSTDCNAQDRTYRASESSKKTKRLKQKQIKGHIIKCQDNYRK